MALGRVVVGGRLWGMRSEQPSFTDVEYGNRRRVSRRERFLETMDATIPWAAWVGVIEPHYYADGPGKRGRKAKPVETMLRMYLLQVWFSLSDEGVEDAIYDSYAMRRFMGLDFAVEQVPDATTLLHFRHLLEKHQARGEAVRGAEPDLRRAGLDHAWRFDRGCHDHRRPVVDEERHGCAGSRDAPDEEGQPVVLRDEGPHRCRRRHRVRPLGHCHRRKRP